MSGRISADLRNRGSSFSKRKREHKENNSSSYDDEQASLMERGEMQIEGTSPLMHLRSSKNEESKNDSQTIKGVRSPRNLVEDVYMIDYFFSIDSGHKDFVRSMI
jgi:hypothetical protein